MLYHKSKDYMSNIFHQANTYNMCLNIIQASNITTKLSSQMIRDCVAKKKTNDRTTEMWTFEGKYTGRIKWFFWLPISKIILPCCDIIPQFKKIRKSFPSWPIINSYIKWCIWTLIDSSQCISNTNKQDMQILLSQEKSEKNVRTTEMWIFKEI